MPISADKRALYPKDWPAISRRIREREGNRCKWCAAPNGKTICRGERCDAGTYMVENGEVFDENDGRRMGVARGSEYFGRFVKVVLTTAHLDHGLADHSDENLAALCQQCHFRHDAPQHRASAAKTRRSRKAVGDLLGDTP